ncbi:unnamed protein product [Ilex paraguariensis]|uniref:Filament-like plant protein 4 n=1 Tax=Ilex paraguariensis TaxID=185542 RepID=A0ABC8RUR5_9AQUA
MSPCTGWEKAEAEAAAIKNHLESVTLLKLSAEDRASHLDGALKECMRQIRNLKEEHEQKLHEVVLTKTKQWAKIKLDFEAKINNLDQELLRSAAENAALSRSLQERSNMVIKLSEEKSQAEAEIELLKSNIDSCGREINSSKYELHIATKELEIRNEEKNMSVRSAEVANKQHLEGVKKIAKLEAECQRLRGLVRKKLPGPAALAQMKLEVENLGRDFGETRVRRSPVKAPNQHLPSLPEFSLDSLQKYHKENDLLTERLLAMEEETKMLKEALAKRNSELQAARNICAKTIGKLQSLEAQLQAPSEQKRTPKSIVLIPTEGSFSQNASNPPSLTSISGDGNDDEASCAGSWATALVSELSHVKKEKNIESPNKAENANHLELMDDFLEMEKLAYLSNGSNGAISSSDIPNNTRCETQGLLEDQVSFKVEVSDLNSQCDAESLPFMKLRSRISMLLESMSKDTDMEKVLEGIRHVVQDMHNGLHQQPVEATHLPDEMCREASLEDAELHAEKEISLFQNCKYGTDTVHTISQELEAAISQIHNFILFLGKEAKAVLVPSPDGDGLGQKLEEFSDTFNEVINGSTSLVVFVLNLSYVLTKASELHFNVLGYKNAEAETCSSDCIDKVALSENKGVQDSTGEKYLNGCARFSGSISDSDIPHERGFVPTSESAASTRKCSPEEVEQLILEKDNMVIDLARCTENLESTKFQLQETEQLLAEVKSQLTSAQKLNSLAETQLKCMAESYRSLEVRAEELQTEINLLRTKTENLDNELHEEKRSHQDALSRCKDLEEQLQRIGSCPAVDIDTKTDQERELAAAAEKLAECQETIFLLGKQLKTLRPQTEIRWSAYSQRSHKGEGFSEEEPTTSGMKLHESDPAEMDTAPSADLQGLNGESPMDLHNAPLSFPDSEPNNLLRSPSGSKRPKHLPTKSSSFSSLPAPTPEKHSRGFGRLFSSK